MEADHRVDEVGCGTTTLYSEVPLWEFREVVAIQTQADRLLRIDGEAPVVEGLRQELFHFCLG